MGASTFLSEHHEMNRLVIILVVWGFAASGALAADGDSTTWEGFYEGNVLPTADTSCKSTA